MKKLLVLLLLIVAGCSEKSESTGGVDYTTDMSAQMSSENDLNKNGCQFENDVISEKTLVCSDASDEFTHYRRQISIYRYERFTSHVKLKMISHAPNGKLLNEPTISALGAKWQAAYRTIYMPGTLRGGSEREKSFVKLTEIGPLANTLEFLLTQMLRNHVIVDIDSENSISLDFTDANDMQIRDFKEEVFSYTQSLHEMNDERSENYLGALSLMLDIGQALNIL